MAARREKVGIVASRMPEVITALELADSSLLPVIQEVQRDEVTHLFLVIENARGRRMFLLTADHLFDLELLNDVESLEKLHPRAHFFHDGVHGKPLAALSRRERARLVRDLPLCAEEFEKLCGSAPMCHFGLAELLALYDVAWYLRHGCQTAEQSVERFHTLFPGEDAGFYKYGKPRRGSMLSFSLDYHRPLSEHDLYRRCLGGVVIVEA